MVKVRTAIIGAGKVAHYHARALQLIPGVEFTAVCDTLQERALQFADSYGISSYTDTDRMLEKEDLQVVIVCTPHPCHKQPTISAAASGAHVLVEKPMAHTLIDCDEMITYAHKKDVKIGVMSQRRLYAPVQRMKKAIDQGKIGRPVLASVQVLGWRGEDYYKSDPWRGKWITEGGGVLVNQAVHQLDLLQWFLGPIDGLFGYWDNFNHPGIEVEDSAAALVRFENGALCTLMLSNSIRPGLYSKIHVFGDQGASVGVQTDGGSMFIAGISEIHDAPFNDLWTVPGEAERLDQWQQQDRELFATIDPIQHYHTLQVQDFIQAVLEDRPPLVPGEEGRRPVEIFTALYRSHRDQKPVKFPLDAKAGSYEFDGRFTRME